MPSHSFVNLPTTTVPHIKLTVKLTGSKEWYLRKLKLEATINEKEKTEKNQLKITDLKKVSINKVDKYLFVE
jgi:hypothetical protein